MSDYFEYSLWDLVDSAYLIVAVVSALALEFFMIVSHSFTDFPTVVASIQLYIIITIIMAVIYHTMWDVEYSTLLNIIVRSMFIILPIGVLWAYMDGYATDTLLNFEWLFTHDMIYIVTTTQVIVVLIFMLGLKDYVVVQR